MTVEEIKKCVTTSKNAKMNMELLTFCREPRNYKSMSKNWKDRKSLFDSLVELKKANALYVDVGKYCITDEAVEVLRSLER